MPVCSQCGTENPEIAKFCLACGSALEVSAPAQEVRKVVTIVFSDLKGSTSMGERLDSEALREVMTRYFDTMRAELERHGGVVEKFIGDAVMAVFGLPRLHEDDALRAVRAAAGMQGALEKLNDELERVFGVRLANRTGVNTGEVVSGDPAAGQRLVTGDAVNVAARLEQAAGEQEVLLGDLTYRLVRDYVAVEPVEPLELKGKAEPVPAYRLVSLIEGGERPRRLDSPMVGRDSELAVLRDAFAEAVAETRPRLVTVMGEAGVGKSRLMDEFIRSLEGEAMVLRGRCLAYGDGISFWPLAEAVREAAGIAERDTSEEAHAKLSALDDDEDVIARVASAIGLTQEPFPVQELYWGARKLLEKLAAARPLVVLFEDIHWAEATFLELVEHVVGSAEARLLLVCPTRRELLERLPDWSATPPARRIELEPLSDDHAREVASHLLGQAGLEDEVRTRVVEAAQGNPLFVEQLLSMLIDEGIIRFEDGCWRAVGAIDRVSVPPTIQALLAARLDYLEPEERAVIEPAAVIGHIFVRDAVEYLTAESLQPAVGAQLHSLTDKQFIHEDRSRPAEEEAFRFHHILIRDTTYEGILKRGRATLHERFVQWADGVNREGAVEYEEILGYHLEQAHRYLSELGPLDERGRAIGVDASSRLALSGRRAFARGDVPAAANLLGRAIALLPDDDRTRLELLPDYGEALLQVGRFDDAQAVLDEAIGSSRAAGLPTVHAHAGLVLLLVRLRTGDAGNWQDDATAAIDEAMTVFEDAGDHAGLAKAWRLLAWTHGTSCRFGKAAEASESALQHAKLANDVRQKNLAATAYAAAAALGPTPVPDAIERFETIMEQIEGDRQADAILLALLGSLVAMQGSFDQARDHVARARMMLEELRLPVRVAYVAIEAWRVEMLAGDVVAAEAELRRGHDLLVSVGEKYLLSTVAGLLAQTLYILERFDEAVPLGQLARELASEDDVDTQALWRCVQAKLLAREGDFEQAELLVREALEILGSTDAALFTFGALLDLAEVQRLSGDPSLGSTFEEVLRLAQEKGSPVMVGDAERMLAASAADSSPSAV
jgi:class 3 adenylate cyclase/tetratricopeptide (TPR) repeat protein